jgi:hypothetical protein
MPRRRPPPLWMQKSLSPRIPVQRMRAAGTRSIGYNPPNNGISSEHQSRWACIPNVPLITSPRAPRLSHGALDDRTSSINKKGGVSYDAPRWLQIDYVRVHTPQSHPHKHMQRNGHIIPNLPAYHITRGMLPEQAVPISPISPRRKLVVQSELALDPTHWEQTPPSSPRTSFGTPRTPISAGGTPRQRSYRQPNPTTYSSRKYDETKPQSLKSPENMAKSPTSPLNNRARTKSFFPERGDPSILASAEETILHKLGYDRNELRTDSILGPLQRDKTHYMVYRSLHGDDNALQEERYTHRCDRRHVKEENYGKRRVVPPHMKNHGAHVVTKHIGEERTPDSLLDGGMCSLSPIQKRGNRRQFAGGSSGGVSQLSQWRIG